MAEVTIDIKSLPPVLQTSFGYLAEGNWRNANDCFDLALKQMPLNPFACLGKAMTAAYLKTPDELAYVTPDILDNLFFSTALKYAEGSLKDELTMLVIELNFAKQQAEKEMENAADDEQQDDEEKTGKKSDKANWDIEDFREKTKSKRKQRKEKKARSAQNGAEQPETPGAAPEQTAPEQTVPEQTGEPEIFGVVGEKKKTRGKKAAAAVILAALLAASCAAAYLFMLPAYNYRKATGLINEKNFDEGLAVFSALGDYKDAAEQYKTGLYVKALDMLAANDFDGSKAIFEELGDFKDSAEYLETTETKRASYEIATAANAKKGDAVSFGRYESDGNTENGAEELTWIVLDSKDGILTLTTEKSITAMSYNFKDRQTCWASCSLRTWLNSTFIISSFTAEEQKYLLKNDIVTPPNPDYPSESEENSSDRVYLLSLEEALDYLPKLADRKLECTDASAAGTYTDEHGHCCWWLRTPGALLTSAVCVDNFGQVVTIGYDCSQNDRIGVRPVIVIDTKTE